MDTNNTIKEFEHDKFREFLATQSSDTKIYIGCDSERIRRDGAEYADFMMVAVVHIDGCRGCRIFSKVVRERNYDAKLDKPTMRLMTEAYKVAEFYADIKDDIERFHSEIHLDLNAQAVHASNHVAAQAIGYIRGTCNIEPSIKPAAWGASYAADRAKEIEGFKKNPPTAEKLAKEYKRGKVRS